MFAEVEEVCSHKKTNQQTTNIRYPHNTCSNESRAKRRRRRRRRRRKKRKKRKEEGEGEKEEKEEEEEEEGEEEIRRVRTQKNFFSQSQTKFLLNQARKLFEDLTTVEPISGALQVTLPNSPPFISQKQKELATLLGNSLPAYTDVKILKELENQVFFLLFYLFYFVLIFLTDLSHRLIG